MSFPNSRKKGSVDGRERKESGKVGIRTVRIDEKKSTRGFILKRVEKRT